MEICEQQSEIGPPTLLNIWLCGRKKDLSVMGVRVGETNFFLSQSIGIVETSI